MIVKHADRIEHIVNGRLHREDGPAIEFDSGDKEWWFNGLRHREDGPAVIWYNGDYQIWWVHGKRHREDGPAYFHKVSGQIFTRYYLNNHRIPSEEEFQKLVKLKSFW